MNEKWEETKTLRRRNAGMTREEWSEQKKKIAAEKEAQKDPAAVALGKKRWAGKSAAERSKHGQVMAESRWDSRY